MFKYATFLTVTHKSGTTAELTSVLASELVFAFFCKRSSFFLNRINEQGSQIRFPRGITGDRNSPKCRKSLSTSTGTTAPGQTPRHQHAPARLATELQTSASVLIPARQKLTICSQKNHATYMYIK